MKIECLFCFAMIAAGLLTVNPAAAHLDESTQVLLPDPLVKTFDAEDLKSMGQVETADDPAARHKKAAVFKGAGSGVELDFGELPIGIYTVLVSAKVTEPNAFVPSIDLKINATDREQTKPLYFTLEVNSGRDGAVERHRLRVPYSKEKEFEYIAKIYFHAPAQRRYSGKLSMGTGSIIREVAVDYIDLRNPLGELVFAPLKTKRVFLTAGEIETMRAAAAKEGKLPKPIRAKPLSPEERRQKDDLIWGNSIMPLNANPAGCNHSGYADFYGEIFKKEEARLGKPLGSWERPRYDSYETVCQLVNTQLNLTYTRADYDAGKALPAPWPFAEDKGGGFFDGAKWGYDKSFNSLLIPLLIQQRYFCVLDALGAVPEAWCVKDRSNLPQRYLLTGDSEAAADAAFLLAGYAYHYPGYEFNPHAVFNIMQDARTFHPANFRGRGCSYMGWCTDGIASILKAYDSLFPYIQGNQELASRIGRFIPWVKKPDDVIKLVDTFLVQRAAMDGVRFMLSAQIVPAAATTLGPCPVADKYLDMYVYIGGIYKLDTRIALLDDIYKGHSRDGMNYIGSTFYVIGESYGGLFENTAILKKYVAAGGDKRFDLLDPVRFPRLKALPEGLPGLYTAGGHRAGIGDVQDPQGWIKPWTHLMKDEVLNVYVEGWQWTRDPHFAWILVNQRGQKEIPDQEWKKITAAAAQSRDPLLHNESGILEGFGLARLEENVDATDRRLKHSATLRFAVGSGHSHPDILDLEVYGYGVRMSSDLGGRSSGQYGKPTVMSTFVHNLVQVDEGDFTDGPQNSTALGWLTAFKPTPLAQYVAGGGRSYAQPQVKDYRRGVLQVMADGGDLARPARGYLFDVLRVTGGKVHTWCFHGCVSEAFESNAGLKPAESDLAKRYLARHQEGTKLEGKTPDVLEATWQLRRKEEVFKGIPLANAEQKMLEDLYDPAAPLKFTRVRLFDHPGEKVMAGNFYCNDRRQLSFPLLHVRREGPQDLKSVYPALIEPYAGEPLVREARRLKSDGDTVALKVTTTLGQTDLLFASPERGKNVTLEGGLVMSGDAALISRDAKGLRLLTLVGGSELADAQVRVTCSRAQYTAKVQTIKGDGISMTLAEPLPSKLLDGEVFTVGNDQHQTTFRAASISGTSAAWARSTPSFRGGVMNVDPEGRFAQLDIKPDLASYHPAYFDGMTVINEKGQVLGKCKLELGDRYWYTAWPEARRHLAKIEKADLTDADKDGKVTVTMIAREKQRKFAADGTTIEEVPPGSKMFTVEVTRLREDGYMLFTKQHPREFLDAAKVPHPGWPYHRQIFRNESGDKEWIVNMPGDIYHLTVEGKKLAAADFPDADGDGRAIVELHEFGPGDTITAATHVYLQRLDAMGAGIYELRANAACKVALPAKGIELSSDDGKTWKPAPTAPDGKLLAAAFEESQLGPGRLLLRIK